MATTRLYLDMRRETKDGYPIRLGINHKGKTAYMNLNVFVTEKQWDKNGCKVVGHPSKATLNRYLSMKKMEADEILREHSLTHSLHTYSAIQLRDIILRAGDSPQVAKPLFIDSFNKFASMKSEGTKRLYMETFSKLRKYTDITSLTFEDITRDWLTKFDQHMAAKGDMTNTRNIHLRNIRAVFNYAIDEEIIDIYPFRKFKIRPERTAKRSLTVDELRVLFDYQVEDYAIEYLDMFKLTFMLIGINIADLTHLKNITSDGRIEYNRAKTHRPYSIKVEPEAMRLIQKYKGEKYLLSPLDRFQSHNNYVAHMNTALQNIGEVRLVKCGRVYRKDRTPLFPKLTSYWARHSWASIAAELDIPKETIAKALGHGGNSVTDIYIDFDMRKVDEANRKVLDWVLYGKR